MEEQEGPFTYIIPQKVGYTCTGCKHLRESIKVNHRVPSTNFVCMVNALPGAAPHLFGKTLNSNLVNNTVIPSADCPFMPKV